MVPVLLQSLRSHEALPEGHARQVIALRSLRPATAATRALRALRALGRRHRQLTAEITALDELIEPLVTTINPTLLELNGVGPRSPASS